LIVVAAAGFEPATSGE